MNNGDKEQENQTQPSAKEVYDQKKREKDSHKVRHQQSKERKNYFRYVPIIIIILITLGALGYGVYFIVRNTQPVEPDLSVAIPIMDSRSHFPVGTNFPEYNSNPPTSGPHYEETAHSGFRDEVIADQNIIHNLEHGDVWISYHPRISDNIVQQLKKFGAAKVIVTSREANEMDIALVSWGRLDTFNIENNILPETRVNDFIKRYLNNGPEKITTPTRGI